jgi:phosphoribosylaminoimidazolecarboxamide formyltransferase/IMP cyclohydrolase
MITRALISVSDKTGLLELAKFLKEKNIEILSTGGTAKALRDANIPVKDVSEHTGFPEIMDGRVKTLHPKIHGGILAVRGNKEHQAAMDKHQIPPIDLIIINLYPFEETVAKGADFNTCIENIDIGGPSLIRGAAKNHAHVTIVVDPADYALVMDEIKAAGDTSLATKKSLAAKAYGRTAAYDSAISRWFAAQLGNPFPASLTVAGNLKQVLHYGENPHQKAAFYTTDTVGTLAAAKQVQGSELSYNNLNDASAAFELVREFDAPAVAIIKHANPCGVAVGKDITEAFKKALACDPVSAYGGIIATNRPLTKDFCDALGKLFLEVMIAPDADTAAKTALASRKKLKLLLSGPITKAKPLMVVKSVSGGFLYQDEDTIVLNGAPKTITKKAPSKAQMDDLYFATTIAKHVKSNTIVLVRDGATIGIGAGQMSRIDSTRIACDKAKSAGLSTKDAVLASDAFFPFADNVELAAEAGIAAIIQPGGSIRDDEVIASADTHGIAMVFTGVRHFRH